MCWLDSISMGWYEGVGAALQARDPSKLYVTVSYRNEYKSVDWPLS